MAKRKIPGSSKKIPGKGRMPSVNMGNFLTKVPRQDSAGDWNKLHRTVVRDRKGRFAGGVGFAWQGLEAMAQEITWAVDTEMQSIEAKMNQIAIEMEDWAKANHVWENRTGNAEAGLQAQVVKNGPSSWTIWLGHGRDVHYGLWLEVRWGGKYAIILPTLQQFAPRIGATAVAPGIGAPSDG